MELAYLRELPGVTPEVALERAGGYLRGRGYREAGAGRFVRGRRLAGLYTMSRMDRLRTALAVEVRGSDGGCEVGLRYSVGTLGQLITDTNRRFWDVEVRDLCDHLLDRPDSGRWAEHVREARRDAIRFVLASFLAAVVCCGLAIALYRLTT